MEYTLQVDCAKWLNTKRNESREGTLYTAKNLSKYSRCRVDVYTADKSKLIFTFVNGVGRTS